MNYFRNIFSLLAVLISGLPLAAQVKTVPAPERSILQFSGVVVDSDSLQPVPFTAVIIKNTNRGTFADASGYFSFVAQKGDTIQFITLGYHNASFVLPDTLTSNRYSLIQLLKRDTFELKEAVIYPWPSKEQFKDAFLRLDVPNDDMARASKNLQQAALVQTASTIGNDGSMAYKATMQQQSSKMYYAGQLPPNNLLNPIAWSRFVQAWRSGALKKQ